MKIKNLIYILIATLAVSCNNDDEAGVVGLSTEAALVIETDKALRSQQISLQLVDVNDVNQTSEAIFYVNDEAIQGNTFSSTLAGTYNIKASYILNGLEKTTATQVVDVFIPKRKLLLEGFTGTWCGYCPRKKLAINALRAITDHVAVVSIHGNSSGSGVDPLTIEDGTFLKNELQIPGYPTGVMNRATFWNFDPSNVASRPFMELAGEDTNVAISIHSEVTQADLLVTASIISETSLTDLKMVVYLLEDGILFDQASYYDDDPNSPYFGQGNPIPNYKHNEVLREILTDPLGDVVATLNPLVATEMSFSTTIPSEFNTENLQLIVALFDANGIAINAQHARIDEFKNFE